MSSRYLATYDAEPPPAAFLKGQADETALTFRSLLTYPMPDLAGDYVVPSGCNFDLHARDPSIDLEHGRDKFVKGRPVAWARESFEEPGAPYAVEMLPLDFAAPGRPADVHTVPVGTEFYKSGDKISMQVFALREQGALPATSLEFELVPGFYKAIGWSELERRQAYHFDRVNVRRWTVCAKGVNPGALLVSKSLPAAQQVPEPLAKILHDRRVLVDNRYEPLCEVIYKSLAAALLVEKGMPLPQRRPQPQQQQPAAPAPAQPAPAAAPAPALAPEPAPEADLTTENEVEGAPEEPGPSGGVAAKLEFVQGVSDLCQMYEQNMQSSDHPGLRAAAKEDIEQVMTLLGKIQSRAQKHDAKLNGDSPEMGDDAEGDASELDAGEMDDDSADADTATDEADTGDDDGKKKGKKKPFGKALELDDEGVVVCPRPVYRKSLYDGRVRRFSEADLPVPRKPAPVKKAPEVKAEPELSAAELAELSAALAALNKRVAYLT